MRSHGRPGVPGHGGLARLTRERTSSTTAFGAAAIAGLVTVLGCGAQSLVPIDVVGDAPFSDVELRIVPSIGSRKTVPHASFSSTRPLPIGIYLPEKASGMVQLIAEAIDGACVVGKGSAVATDVRSGAVSAAVTLRMTHVTGCEPPSDGGAGGRAGGEGTAGVGGATGGTGLGGGPGATGGSSSGGAGGTGLGGRAAGGAMAVGGRGAGGRGGSEGGSAGSAGMAGATGAASGGSSAGGTGAGGRGSAGMGGLVGSGGAATGGTGAGGRGAGSGGGGESGAGGGPPRSCGNGTKEPSESCDGADLGNQTCSSIGLGALGTLSCANDCTLVTSACRPTLVMFGGSRNGSYAIADLLAETWEYHDGKWKDSTPASPAASPGARYRAGVGSFKGTVVLFGGYGLTTASATSAAYLNDTWVWDGSTWTSKSTAHRPAMRYAPALGTLNDRLFMFGGYNGSPLNDVWEWDGADWIDRTPATRPSARDGASLANIGGDRLVLFGAGGGDTWEWNGETWTLAAPATSPSARQYLKSATLNGQVILFGGSTGQSSTSTYYEETWAWSGKTWTRLVAAGPPEGRRDFGLGPTGNAVLMMGGYSPAATGLDDVWIFDGSAWTRGAAGPSGRMGAFMAAR